MFFLIIKNIFVEREMYEYDNISSKMILLFIVYFYFYNFYGKI